jgi:cell division protein FtsI (penicillin-binding protein 3)
MATFKNEVLVRVYIVVFAVVLVGVAIFAKAVRISMVEGKFWRDKIENQYFQMRKVEAGRGNILASNGGLLATSLPYFELAFDPNSSGMTDADFDLNIDSLAYCLATYVDQSFTPEGMRDYLIEMRKAKKQYIPIKKEANYEEYEQISQFPLFRMGQFKGGFIAIPKFKRKHPYGMLASRTIGYDRKYSTAIGLEGYYEEVLDGEQGEQLMRRLTKDIWIPVNNFSKIDPTGGLDIKTTLDVDIQDVAEGSLLAALKSHNAEYGVALVMDVKTGGIRAIANLGRTKKGKIWETYNHAVGTSTEPGSTFKLASMMALLEDKKVQLDDSIYLDKGRATFFNQVMVDASKHGLDSTTVRHAFEISSNVAIAKLVQEHYGDEVEAAEFIERLKQFNLNHKTGVEINGEADPYIKEAYSTEDNWSGLSLPWMAHGYELKLTPLQLLSFYNTVANDGRQMKPYLVSETQKFGETVERFPPKVVKKQIASKKTIRLAQELLEGVVLNGTAKRYQTDRYTFAGKTGTAQINYKRSNGKTTVGGYQSSFVGYFPTEDPVYSCIVVIYKPKNGRYYGSDVALPVFRSIADKIFTLKPDLFERFEEETWVQSAKATKGNIGAQSDFKYLFDEIDVDYEPNKSAEFVVVDQDSTEQLHFLNKDIQVEQVPSVVGMGLRDAVYVLENLGLRVEVNGSGKVVNQSIRSGTMLRGQTVALRLN